MDVVFFVRAHTDNHGLSQGGIQTASELLSYWLIHTKNLLIRDACVIPNSRIDGRVAQWGERHVYTVDVTGSSPVPPTI